MIKDDLPTVLILVGQITRDLDSKLVTAAALAAKNCRAVIALKEEAWHIGGHSRALVFHGKEVIQRSNRSFESRTHFADQLLRNGSGIVYLGDEGGMFASNSWKEQVLGKHRIDGLRLRAIDRFCVWGDKQRRVIADYAKETEESIRVTGSPRFDICSQRFDWIDRGEVQEIRNRFGPFILACSRFTSAANKRGIQHMFDRKLDGVDWPGSLDRHSFRDLWFSKWRQDLHDLAEFLALVKELAAAEPERHIVLRPHDSEDGDFYRQVFMKSKNVTVLHEGNVMKWIRASDLVVHSNCTTGIEAVLARRPVLNFRPKDENRPRLDVEVAGEAGITASSVPEALEEIDALLAGKRPEQAWSPVAKKVLNNLQNDAIPILVDETLSVIHERGINSSRLKLPLSMFGYSGIDIVRKYRGQRKRDRGQFDLEHIEAMLEGCRANGIGATRLREITPHAVVIDPA